MSSFKALHCGVKCSISTLLSNRVNLLNRWLLAEESIRYLNLLEISHKKEKMHQQMGSNYVGEKSFKTATIIRVFECFALSQSACCTMQKDFELPNITILSRLTSKVKTLDEMPYMHIVFSQLDDERQKRCLSIIDEVYLKTILQYHSGIVFGKAVKKNC